MNDRINHVGVFLLGITVWKTDSRAGGRTPNRSQPAGAMQAGVGDGQHEQHQVLGAPPCPLLCFALLVGVDRVYLLLRSLAVGLERSFRCGEGIVPDLTWDVQTVFRMAWLVLETLLTKLTPAQKQMMHNFPHRKVLHPVCLLAIRCHIIVSQFGFFFFPKWSRVVGSRNERQNISM